MIKFTVEKKLLEKATAMLSQVAGLKSFGATPSETSGFILTPTTISLSNLNEANGVTIDDLPITVVDGDINAHLDSTYMVNTKKLDSVVRGSGQTVNFCIEDGSKVIIGENNRRYELALFSTARREIQEAQMLGYQIDVPVVLKALADSTAITDNSKTSALSGSLFSGTAIMSSDRISGLYIQSGGLFGEGVQDLMMCPDLFATCLAKTKVAQAEPGLTPDGRRFVLKFDNITLYKTLLTEKFPKESLLNLLDNLKLAAAGTANIPIVQAVVNIDDFKVKLKELHNIVEAEEYYLSYNRDNCLRIHASNVKGGTDGEATVGAAVTIPAELDGTISGLFTYTHLDLIGRLFPAGTEVRLLSTLNLKGKKPGLRYLAVHTEEKSYFFVPMEP